MRMKVDVAIRAAADLIMGLSSLESNSFVEIDDGLDYREVIRPSKLYVDDLEVDDVIEFDYTDLEGNQSHRTGTVLEGRQAGKHGRLMMVFDTDRDEHRWFYMQNMTNVRLAQPH